MDHKYPAHLHDETRRSIAVSYIQHEMRKLFPSLKRNEDFVLLDADIKGWFQDNPTLSPVRDFWNGVHAISMGFRLKHIGEWLTSENMTWERKNIFVQDIRFGANFPELAVVGVRPSVEEVRDWYFSPENKQALDEAKNAHDKRSAQTAERNTFPIIIRKLLHDDAVVMDGNRRLLRAILFELEEVDAFVGTQVTNPPLFNYWVSTSVFLDLVSAHRYWIKMGRDMTEEIAKVIGEFIRDSSVAEYELMNRCLNATSFSEDAALLEAIQKRL